MNPLYMQQLATGAGQIPLPQDQTTNSPPMDMNALMGRLKANPTDAIREAGYRVPEELTGNPQATVMHLLQTGQIGGPMMQKISPFLRMVGFR